MDKKLLFEKLKEAIEKNLQLALEAAKNTYDVATGPDSKAENKYDTRGLEASYLAGAQAQRVQDLRETLGLISNIKIKTFSRDSKIALTAVVEMSVGNRISCVLLLSKGGGQSVSFNGKQIQVVTPESPLGESLVGRSVGDELEINQKIFEIISVS